MPARSVIPEEAELKSGRISRGKISRLNELDLLRFVAAVCVVMFHYAFRGFAADSMSALPYPSIAPMAKYGFLGVDFFFMISGFVILMTAANGKLQSFWVSRAARLLPAFWACCSATFITICLIGAPKFHATFEQYLINMTMVGVFLKTPSIDGVYWSLLVELRFYFLISLVLALRLINKIERIFWIWLAVTTVLHFFPVNSIDQVLITNYSSCFIAGGALYLIWSRGITWYRAGLLFSTLCMSLVKVVDSLPKLEQKYLEVFDPAVVVCVVVLSYFTLLAVALRRTNCLGGRSWVWAGAISYPLYLLHQNIGYMVFNAAYGVVNDHLLFWSVFFGVLLLSYGVHAYVEKPLLPRLKILLNAVSSNFVSSFRISHVS